MYAHMPYIDPIGIQARAIFLVKFVFSAHLAARTLHNKIFSIWKKHVFFLYHASFCRCGTLQLGVTKTRLFVAVNAAQHTTTFPPRRLVGSAIRTTHALWSSVRDEATTGLRKTANTNWSVIFYDGDMLESQGEMVGNGWNGCDMCQVNHLEKFSKKDLSKLTTDLEHSPNGCTSSKDRFWIADPNV